MTQPMDRYRCEADSSCDREAHKPKAGPAELILCPTHRQELLNEAEAECARLRAELSEVAGSYESFIETLCTIVPDGDEAEYSNPEGDIESILVDVFTAYRDRSEKEHEGE